MQHFGLLGSGIHYSLSPQIHQLIFSALNKQATYELLDWPTFTREQLANYAGFNVTIPHKAAVVKLLDRYDEHAQQIQAVNTIVNNGSEFVGYNTDWLGFLRSIDQTQWQGKQILIIGAGGAARAVYYALQQMNTSVTIANRTIANCQFADSQTRVVSLEQAANELTTYDYVVQATNQDFIWLTKAKFVYDLRYTTTNCQQNGLKMLIHQAILAQEYFWQQPITDFMQLADIIERKILNELNK